MTSPSQPPAVGLPGRRTTVALTLALLAVGILAGVAIGPGPSSSLASTRRSSLVAQSLALLATAAQRAKAQTSASATASPEPAPTETTVQSRHRRIRKAAQPSQPTQAGSNETAEESSVSESGSSQKQTTTKKPSESSGEKTASTPARLPPITHVWLIALSQQSFTTALAQPTSDPYLAGQLVPEGTLLSNYTLTAAGALANDIALLSGQGVNTETERDCPSYSEVQPQTIAASSGLAEGVGCIYPKTVQTLADQLSDANLTWRAYLQDMAPASPATVTTGATTTPASPATPANPAEASAGPTCRHPALGSSEPSVAPAQGSDYLGYRNPFVYFDSLLQSGACTSEDVDLDQLQPDLTTPANTPNLSWIVPAACHDGASTQCATGTPSGLAAADAFLKEIVPEIEASADYKSHGLIVITFDAGPSSTASTQSGARVGTLLLSPFVKTKTKLGRIFQNFSLLKSLERLFGVPLLGHAADQSVVQFGADVYRTTETAAKAASRPRHAVVPQSG